MNPRAPPLTPLRCVRGSDIRRAATSRALQARLTHRDLWTKEEGVQREDALLLSLRQTQNSRLHSGRMESGFLLMAYLSVPAPGFVTGGGVNFTVSFSFATIPGDVLSRRIWTLPLCHLRTGRHPRQAQRHQAKRPRWSEAGAAEIVKECFWGRTSSSIE